MVALGSILVLCSPLVDIYTCKNSNIFLSYQLFQWKMSNLCAHWKLFLKVLITPGETPALKSAAC